MKPKTTSAEPEHFKIMEVILNFLLFNSPDAPELVNRKFYRLNDEIINILTPEIGVDQIDFEKLMIFFEDFITELLQVEIRTSELIDIVKCYQDSKEKLINQKLFELQKKSYSFRFLYLPTKLSDAEIANTLVVRRFIPVQIFTYLANRFGAIISLLEIVNEDKITKEQYVNFLEICKFEYDVPITIKFATNYLFGCDRSHQNFFTQKDGEDYQQWVKSEIDKQPKFTFKLN